MCVRFTILLKKSRWHLSLKAVIYILVTIVIRSDRQQRKIVCYKNWSCEHQFLFHFILGILILKCFACDVHMFGFFSASTLMFSILYFSIFVVIGLRRLNARHRSILFEFSGYALKAFYPILISLPPSLPPLGL